MTDDNDLGQVQDDYSSEPPKSSKPSRRKSPIRLSHARLIEALSYDADSGVFTWRVSGLPSGWLDKSGYLFICIDQETHLAHRLAWFYVHGVWPDDEIDHENCVKNDNRISNLREATRNQNVRNIMRPKHNTSGVKGVTWHKRREKWQASIQVDGHLKYLGLFTSVDLAAEAYQAASAKYHGDFARLS